MSSEFHTVARPYAKAAFEYAVEHKGVESWSNLLKGATQVATDASFQRLLSDPKVSSEQCAELLLSVLGNSASEAFANFIRQLAENDRLVALPDMSELFEQSMAELLKTQEVEVTSSHVLTAEQQQRLQAALNKKLQRTVNIHYLIDPSLMGGMIVKAGDWVMDGSVKSQLQKLMQQLIA